MWQIVKSELKYYRIVFTAPIFFIIMFQIMEFIILKTISEMRSTQVDYANNSGALFFIFFSLFSILHRRIKEKRTRFFTTLPLSNKQLALSRFWLSIIPLTIFIIYFLSIHLIVKSIWNIELSIPRLELGLILIIFAGFIRARDDWFSHWTFGKRIQNTFITVSIIQILVVVLFLGLPKSNTDSLTVFQNYSEIIFFLLGLVIMVTTIYSYQKRKTYLS